MGFILASEEVAGGCCLLGALHAELYYMTSFSSPHPWCPKVMS